RNARLRADLREALALDACDPRGPSFTRRRSAQLAQEITSERAVLRGCRWFGDLDVDDEHDPAPWPAHGSPLPHVGHGCLTTRKPVRNRASNGTPSALDSRKASAGVTGPRPLAASLTVFKRMRMASARQVSVPKSARAVFRLALKRRCSSAVKTSFWYAR